MDSSDTARSGEECLALPDGLLDPTQFTPVEGGWRVRETQTHYVDIYPMLYNDRIVTVPKGMPTVVDRYWCYDKGGAAFLAAAAWDGAQESEPVGWKKAYGNRYPQGEGVRG